MDHVRIDPKFRRRPRPKRAGWAAREVFKFLLEVSAEFDLRGRFPASMQDTAWLADEWANGDEKAVPTCGLMLVENLSKLREVGLVHQEGDTLVISDWADFYTPTKTNAERQAGWRARNTPRPDVTPVTPAVTPVTEPVTNNGRNKSNATEQNDTAQNSTTQNDVRTPPVDAVAAPVAATPPPAPAAAQAERRAVGRIEAPTTSPEAWSGEDFWRWAQDRRQATGYLPERAPHPRKLSSWWSEARMLVPEVQRLKDAFYRYGEDAFWRDKDPPYPFGGFMSQWERFVPAAEEEDVHAA